MQKLTNKQKKEIECLEYFFLDVSYEDSQTMNMLDDGLDIKQSENGVSPEVAYFQITDSGYKTVVTTSRGKLRKLLDAKKWRLRMMDMYEQGVIEGTTPYETLLKYENGERIPHSVAEFMARTMFKGIDYDLIMDFYNSNFKKF